LKPYAILTLHKATNVHDNRTLARMLDAFLAVSKCMPIIFPAHPRTLKLIQSQELSDYFVDYAVQEPEPLDGRVRIRVIPELGYLDFLRLMSGARVVLTDSDGIQDEPRCWECHASPCEITRKDLLRSSKGLTSWRDRSQQRLLMNLTARMLTDGSRAGFPATGMEMQPNESSKY
jgi:UDP-N-acetylglucosamine 2-epimerase